MPSSWDPKVRARFMRLRRAMAGTARARVQSFLDVVYKSQMRSRGARLVGRGDCGYAGPVAASSGRCGLKLVLDHPCTCVIPTFTSEYPTEAFQTSHSGGVRRF